VLNTYTYPCFALGRGSNLLGRDAGGRAAAAAPGQAFERFRVELEIQILGNEIKV
jgi:hypothetical protein